MRTALFFERCEVVYGCTDPCGIETAMFSPSRSLFCLIVASKKLFSRLGKVLFRLKRACPVLTFVPSCAL